MKNLGFYIVLLLSLQFSTKAQVSFKASVASKKVQVGQRFSVEFKVNSRGDNFQAPDFNGFRVLGGPNTSVSTYMDNSGTRFNLTYSYILLAQSTGKFTIGPAFIEVEGKTYRTENLDIEVVEKKESDPQNQKNKDFYYRALVSKSSVYQGEPIFARYRLYYRQNFNNRNPTAEPDFKGFYKEIIEQNRIATSEEYIDGQRYIAGDLQQLVIIPQQVGSFKPGKIGLDLSVQVSSGRRDFFGFPITRNSVVSLEDNFPTIEVKPLPDKGRPENFSGAVGQFDFKVSLSANEITSDESLSLRIELNGTGNIKLVDLPQPNFPQAFEVFDPEITERSSVGSYGMKGSKVIEYLLVPRYSGTYKIDPIEFSFFNPKSKSYQTIKSDPFSVTVKGGQVAPQVSGQAKIGSNEKEEVGFLTKEILYIKSQAGKWRNRNDHFWPSATFFYSIFSIIALALGLYFFWKNENKKRANPGAWREQKAAKKAASRLKSAKIALETQDAALFYQELLAALWGYLGDKLKLAAHEQSREKLQESLSARQLTPALQERLLKLIADAEMLRYTQANLENAQNDYQEASQLLTEIEGEL